MWTVKDPLTLRYFHLREVDHFVFEQLDGATSLGEIQARFLALHAPERLSPGEILQFIQRLWQQGLVLVDRLGSADFTPGSQSQQQTARLRWWANPLYIRFRGVDPNWFLRSLTPWVGWMFSPLALLLAVLVMCSAIGLVLTEWESFARDASRFGGMLSSADLFWFGITIVLVKVFHELGHGVACKRFGAECREIGLLLLAFMPCLYCNVSDAWLLRSRRQRMAISGAGIYIELVLASLASWLWWMSQPGIVHTICCNIMIICSVNTVFLNGNPLLRYDGYYLLTDWVSVPNLRLRAQRAVREVLQRVCCGIRVSPPRPRSPGLQSFLVSYGALSGLYLWCVLLSILWVMYRVADARGLGVIVLVAAAVLILVRCWHTVRHVWAFLCRLHTQKELRPLRIVISAFMIFVAGLGIWHLPIPRSVRAPGQIDSAGEHPVFVLSAGSLRLPRTWQDGDSVVAGEVLAVLENPEIETELLAASGTVARLMTRVQTLEDRRLTDESVSPLISVARVTLADYEQRQAQRQHDRERLTILSPRSGRLLLTDGRTDAEATELQRIGHPLQMRNTGAWIESGTRVCSVAEQSAQDAVVYIAQYDVPLLSPGGRVRLVAQQSARDVFWGSITEISDRPLESLPEIIAATGQIPYSPGAGGTLRPVTPVHEVRVRLDDLSSWLALRQPVWCTIPIGTERVGDRLVRFVSRTLRLE